MTRSDEWTRCLTSMMLSFKVPASSWDEFIRAVCGNAGVLPDQHYLTYVDDGEVITLDSDQGLAEAIAHHNGKGGPGGERTRAFKVCSCGWLPSQVSHTGIAPCWHPEHTTKSETA
jgi:hypothetical protein